MRPIPNTDTDHKAAVDPKVLESLICPVTRTTLVYDANAQELISKKANLAYPIHSGIPVMVPSMARTLSASGVS